MIDKKKGMTALAGKALVITSVLCLSACDSGDISKLKAQTIASNPSFTIAQAFDHRNACSSVSWSERTDDRGRDVVQYRCTFKVDKSYYEKSQQAEIERLNEAMTQEQNSYEAELAQRAKTLEDRQKQEAELESQIDQQSATANPNALFISHQIERMKQDTASFTDQYQKMKANEGQALAKIQSNYDGSIAKIKANGVVVGATETFEWAVNDSGNILIGAGLDLQSSSGRTSHQAYSETIADRAVDCMIRNDAPDLPTYMRKVFVF